MRPTALLAPCLGVSFGARQGHGAKSERMELAAAVSAIAGTAFLGITQSRKQPEDDGSARDHAVQELDLSRMLRRLVSEDGLGSRECAIAVIGEYKRFLRLARLHPGESLQPCAAVDAVWQVRHHTR